MADCMILHIFVDGIIIINIECIKLKNMRTIAFLFLSLFTTSCIGQDFLKDGNVWVYRYRKYDAKGNVTQEMDDHVYYINGESWINGKQYKDVWVADLLERRNGDVYPNVDIPRKNYAASLREENGKVFIRKDVFDKVIQYWAPIYYSSSWPTIVTGCEHYSFIEELATKYLKAEDDEYVLYDFINTDNNKYKDPIIPFVGSISNLLIPTSNLLLDGRPFYDDGSSSEVVLCAYYNDGALKYRNPHFDCELDDSFYLNIEHKTDSVSDVSQKSLVYDGNVWTYLHRSFLNREDTLPAALNYYKYYFNGESYINGKKYKNLWRTEVALITEAHPSYKGNDDRVVLTNYVCSLREEDGKVYVPKQSYSVANKVEDIFYLYGIDSNVQELWSYLPEYEPDSAFSQNRKTDEEYILYDFTREIDKNVIPWIGSQHLLLYPLSSQHRHVKIGLQEPQKKKEEEFLNLFYRDGKLEYKSPNFYPDPFFPEEIADGIEEIVKNEKLKTERAVFNLQGQRINGLQKGLNIVDGKKVWVK